MTDQPYFHNKTEQSWAALSAHTQVKKILPVSVCITGSVRWPRCVCEVSSGWARSVCPCFHSVTTTVEHKHVLQNLTIHFKWFTFVSQLDSVAFCYTRREAVGNLIPQTAGLDPQQSNIQHLLRHRWNLILCTKRTLQENTRTHKRQCCKTLKKVLICCPTLMTFK